MSSLVDTNKVIDAIVASDSGPLAKQEAARLVETWIASMPKFGDSSWKSVGVEMPFYIRLAEKTVVVGMMDRLASSPEHGVVGGEWKSRRAPKIKKDGTPYMGDTEGDWLAEISEGAQLATYALAMREGAFLYKEEKEPAWAPLIAEPILLVRACVKSTPAQIWPKNWEAGVFKFPKDVLDSVRSAYLVKAEQIRAARKSGLVPWQLTGYQCKSYNRMCEFYGDCKKRIYAPPAPVAFHPTDPGFEAAKRLGLDATDPELVVLSQSGYAAVSQCTEKWRRVYDGHAPGETSFELEVGAALHAGLAAVYEQLR